MLRFDTIAVAFALLLFTGCDTGEHDTPEEEPVNHPSVNREDDAVDENPQVSSEPGDAIDQGQNIDFPSEFMDDWASEYDDFDVGFDEPQPLPPFNAVTLEQFDAAWKTSLTASGEPAGELLSPLVEECGFTWDEQPEFADALAMPVNIDLAGVSRLQIIEEICEQVGLYPRYTLDSFKLARGPRPLPVMFAGPFLIEVRELMEVPPYGTGSITVQVTAATMSTDVNSCLQSLNDFDAAMKVMTIDAVRGTGDVHLMDDAGPLYASPAATPEVVRFRVNEGLKNMLRGVEQLDRVSGTISFPLPTEVLTHDFTELTAGESAEWENASIEISRIEPGSETTIEFAVSGVAAADVMLEAYDGNGNPLQITSRFATSLEGEGNAVITVFGSPASVAVRAVTGMTDMTFPFAFENIPLSHFAEMVEDIEPLTFSGDSPVTLRYLRIDAGEFGQDFVFEAVNHSNKDLAAIHMNLHCDNAAGEEIQSIPQSQPGSPIVAAGATAEFSIPAFFAPEGTVSIRPELVEIRAVDGTAWKLEE